MHKFFVPRENIRAQEAVITDKKDIHHLKDVLRLRKGSSILLSDGENSEYTAWIKNMASSEVFLSIQKRQAYPCACNYLLTVACAIPKQSRFDDIVDKLTQLGVARIIPLETQRSVVRIDKKKKMLRQQRWQRIALSAAQQSRRADIPVVAPVMKIEEVLSEGTAYALKIIAALCEKRRTLKEIISPCTHRNILILIGPEGDFTEKEIAGAEAKGCIPVSVGANVLRVDTAAIAVASFIAIYEDR
ncbi:MAG: 16S rRNA (uracil(1498)-N(3))-methyltransferase [Candidatus Omnitrophica bacterium]|nr:16S rRNA (uracil(1498)-N(3))-methyltransferase [Candidatus Omnitrophota bacterium]